MSINLPIPRHSIRILGSMGKAMAQSVEPLPAGGSLPRGTCDPAPLNTTTFEKKKHQLPIEDEIFKAGIKVQQTLDMSKSFDLSNAVSCFQ